MIDLYTWTTPNGHKVSIMLEECGLEYSVHPIDIGKGEQFKPEYVAICPNSKTPAIVDRDGGVPVFESGAILVYLAEKTGKFLPAGGAPRAKAMEWLFWQMANIGPILGQVNHFVNAAPVKLPYAIDRYMTESARLMKVLDDQLARTEYAGGDYSIADMAIYPWMVLAAPLLRSAKPNITGEARNVERWLGAVGARSGVQRGLAVPKV